MLPRGFKQMIAEANAVIDTISVHDALSLVGDPGVVLLDIRETAERQQTGAVKGAVHVPRGFLEFQVDPDSPMHKAEVTPDKRIVLYCASGGRSALSAKTLTDMGFKNVAHIAGGFAAWKEAGGAIESV
jgi:rhodanese-related sulfurtransferase